MIQSISPFDERVEIGNFKLQPSPSELGDWLRKTVLQCIDTKSDPFFDFLHQKLKQSQYLKIP